MEHIYRHFKKHDPILYSYLEKIAPLELITSVHSSKFFENLCRIIIFQQLSGKAGNAILKKFKNLFPNKKISPQQVRKLSIKQLRNVGLSNQKASYMKDLAEKVISKELDLNKLPSLSNNEVVEEIIKVKGLGKWSAEMFLMFTLGREDVFSVGDLGLRNAMKKMYNLTDSTVHEEFLALTEKWSPYRTYACRILWRSLEIKTPSK